MDCPTKMNLESNTYKFDSNMAYFSALLVFLDQLTVYSEGLPTL